MSEPPPPRRRWFRKRGIDLGDLAVETFAVILGILIALTINNWSTSREKSEHLRQARAAIHDEVRTNREKLAELRDYYTGFISKAELQPSFTTLANACQYVDGWHGFQVPIPLSSAYETTLATGLLAQMDFAESRRIAELYAQQKWVTDFINRNLDWYIAVWSRAGAELPCARLFNDEKVIAERQIKVYDDYLANP